MVYLGGEVGDVGRDDLLHLLLDLLGEHTSAQLLEQARVGRLQLLGAAPSALDFKMKSGTYKDLSQAVILSTGTLSSIPLTPA